MYPIIFITDSEDLKGTVNLNSSESLCQDGNVRFTMVPVKAFLIKNNLD